MPYSSLFRSFRYFLAELQECNSDGLYLRRWTCCIVFSRVNFVEGLRLLLTKGRSFCNGYSKYSCQVKIVFQACLSFLVWLKSSCPCSSKTHSYNRFCPPFFLYFLQVADVLFSDESFISLHLPIKATNYFKIFTVTLQ